MKRVPSPLRRNLYNSTRMLSRNFICLGLLCIAKSIHAAPAPTLLDLGYRQMYNLQFAEAHRTFAEWQAQHPDDPLGPASDAAAYLFTEFDRLHILQSEFFTHDEHFITDNKLTPDPALKVKFEGALQKAEAIAARAPQTANSRFAILMCHGLRSDYQALIEKRYVTSFKEMKVARTIAEQLLKDHPEYYDAWIAVGVENYLLSIKPAPIRWLLKIGGGQTDRSLGLEKLKLTAQKGHYLLPFARLLLAVAALREHNTEQARGILQQLAAEYPHNPLYGQELARL